MLTVTVSTEIVCKTRVGCTTNHFDSCVFSFKNPTFHGSHVKQAKIKSMFTIKIESFVQTDEV
jgi:hypothetical protein